MIEQGFNVEKGCAEDNNTKRCWPKALYFLLMKYKKISSDQTF